MSELAWEIRELLEEEARQALMGGWAELQEDEDVTGLTLHLEPVKIDSAPLQVHFDSDQLVMCYPGRHNMFVDFFTEDPEEMKRQVGALAAAVVGGSYQERLRAGTTEVEAEWPGPEGTQRASRRVVKVPGAEGVAWREVEYEEY
jgi:hypothetical protein